MRSRLFNQSKWHRSCDEMVERGNYLKFSQNPKLKEVLSSTGSKVIVEASPSDRIWELVSMLTMLRGERSIGVPTSWVGL